MAQQSNNTDILYNIDDVPSPGKSLAFALQHILAMFAGNVTVPLLVIGIAGLNAGEGTYLIQCALLMAGVVTLLQVVGIGPVGSRLPIVMGTSNAFLSTVTSIVGQYGIGACLGASFIGGLFETFLGSFIGKLKRIFNPLVSGIVVMTIGLTLIPVGIKQAAGSKTAAGMGAPVNLMLSGLVILAIILCHKSRMPFLKSAAILIAIAVGYVASYFAGILDFAPVGEALWFTVPTPLRYRWELRWPAVLSMLFMYVATTVETVGDMNALTVVAQDRQPTEEETRGGILADGLGSSLAAVFNAFPNTSYTQNIGVVNLTGVFSRSVVTVGAVILTVMSLFPKLAAIILCVPEPVLGGATLVTFVMVFISGLSMIREVDFSSRNMLVMTVAVGLGVGLSLVPEAVRAFPESVAMCLTSGVVPASVLAIALDQFLPEREKV